MRTNACFICPCVSPQLLICTVCGDGADDQHDPVNVQEEEEEEEESVDLKEALV